MATKLGRMMTSSDGLLPIMSHDPLITCRCEIRGSLTGRGSARKRLSRPRLLVFPSSLSLIKQEIMSQQIFFCVEVAYKLSIVKSMLLIFYQFFCTVWIEIRSRWKRNHLPMPQYL